MGTERSPIEADGYFPSLRGNAGGEEHDSKLSYAHRLMAAVNELHEELGRVPTGPELEARMERRKTPRPTELTYEVNDNEN